MVLYGLLSSHIALLHPKIYQIFADIESFVFLEQAGGQTDRLAGGQGNQPIGRLRLQKSSHCAAEP